MRDLLRRQILPSRPSSLPLRAEHRKQLTDAEAKSAAVIIALQRELAAARRELNALRTHNEWYARKFKTYEGIAQLIAAAARTEPAR